MTYRAQGVKMSAMSIRDQIRAWLGIDDVVIALKDVPSVVMLQVAESSQKQRHEETIATLGRIEARMINEHIGTPREFAPAILDWDTVQAIALEELERNPQKEQ